MIFNRRFILLLGALIFFLSVSSYGQPGGGGDPGGGQPVPIGGLGILIAGGVALGLKKLLWNNKEKKNPTH